MWKSICAVALCASTVLARVPSPQGKAIVPKPSAKAPTDSITLAHYQQVIDHSNPGLGKFSQRYWYDTTYWKGPGSPIIIFTPGEEDADEYIGYCTNATLNGLLAKEIGAATIVLEHRYWGASSPYDELTTANLQYLTLDNNILDLTTFAQNVQLPFAPHGSNAADVPWVLIGGSYSGALTAWTMYKQPGVFWAGLATSAPVQAISNFWQYFAPIQAGMPKNCSTDVNRVINYMDGVLTHGSQKQIQSLKAQFGLQGVPHNDDFMSALQNGPWLWQERYYFFNSGFFEFCDYVENSVNQTNPALLPGPNGVGTKKALAGYAKWFKTDFLPGECETFGYFNGTDNVECFDTYNSQNPMFSDTSVNNTYDRAWNWMLCNQPLGYWQDAPPAGQQTLVSSLVNTQYWVRQCGLWFPPGPQGQTYGLNKGLTEAETNQQYGGWDITNNTRMIYTNGQYDPWRDATVSSTFRPGGPLQSTASNPVYLIPNGGHCMDLITADNVNPGVAKVQQQELAQLSQWVAEWPKKYGSS